MTRAQLDEIDRITELVDTDPLQLRDVALLLLTERDKERAALKVTANMSAKLSAQLAEAQAEVKRLKARAVDHASTAQAFTAIADIYDRFVDGDLTPYDAIQAVGEQVGDR